MANCLESVSPQSLKSMFDRLEAAEIVENSKRIMDRIREVFKRYIANGVTGAPNYVCMNDEGVYSTRPTIHPANLKLLSKNGFRVYRVRFYGRSPIVGSKQEVSCFKDFITWDGIDFEKELYLPVYGNSKEKTDCIELFPVAT